MNTMLIQDGYNVIHDNIMFIQNEYNVNTR